MGIIAWVVFGLIAGAIARTLVPGSGAYGLVVTAVIGVVGALVGGFIGTQLGFGEVDGFGIEASNTVALSEYSTLYLSVGYLDTEANGLSDICAIDGAVEGLDVNGCLVGL